MCVCVNRGTQDEIVRTISTNVIPTHVKIVSSDSINVTSFLALFFTTFLCVFLTEIIFLRLIKCVPGFSMSPIYIGTICLPRGEGLSIR